MGSSLSEIQTLAWFLGREIVASGLPDPLNLRFEAGKNGPHAHGLQYLLNGLDGGFLDSPVPILDAMPLDEIYFVEARRAEVLEYLQSFAAEYLDALERALAKIDGFESPMGLELLGTVDWQLSQEQRQPNLSDLKAGLAGWMGGGWAAERKLRLFDDRLLECLAPSLSEHQAAH